METLNADSKLCFGFFADNNPFFTFLPDMTHKLIQVTNEKRTEEIFDWKHADITRNKSSN